MFLALAALAWWVVGAPRRLSKRRLLRRCYRHCDEVLGARKFENDRRATRHHYLAFFAGQRLANLLYPRAQLGGTAALPPLRRMTRYVALDLPARSWPQRYHRWDVRSVTLRWTSEAGANAANFIEWLERGRPVQGGGLAQALGLEWTPGLFEHKRDWSRDRVRFDRTRPAAVPDDLGAEGELG